MMYFIKHFKLPIDFISKTKAQLAAEILGGNRKGESFDDDNTAYELVLHMLQEHPELNAFYFTAAGVYGAAAPSRNLPQAEPSG